MTDAFIAVIILGLANGMIGQIVTYSDLFRPVRIWFHDRSEWLGDLIECPLCFGTWTALMISFLAVMRGTDWSGINAVLALLAGAGAINMVGIIAGAYWRFLIALDD